jgi:SAM-dependent methyltransferase
MSQPPELVPTPSKQLTDMRRSLAPAQMEAFRASAFDDLTQVYEAMIDWPKRLANEAPFFRQHFERAGVMRVADVACGTGHHAAMFHAWGLDVTGIDLSPQMIERARAHFGESDRLRWRVRPFDEPLKTAHSFDALVCVGNSLALAPDLQAARRVLQHMFDAVRPDGGVVIVHVLNLYKLPDGPCVWQKALRTTIASERVIVLKGVHRSGDIGRVEMAILATDNAADAAADAADADRKLLRTSQSVPFLGLRANDLQSVAVDNGSTELRLFGNYHDQPFDSATSTDLIMVALRR